MKTLNFALILALTVAFDAQVSGQIAIIRNPQGPASANFKVSNVEVNADVKNQVATVQIAQTFQNVSRRTLETQFVFPLPEDAAINGLTLIVDGEELTGELKPKKEARKIYEEIVRRQRDPALLEYMGRGIFKTSVFPIPAGKNRRVEIRYTQLLKSDTGLVDFSLPLGMTKHCAQTIQNMTIAVRIKSNKELKNVYSPTHDFEIDRSDENRATCRLTLSHVKEQDDIRLLYGTRGSDIGMNLVSYMPEDDGQGYFLLLANPRVKAKKDAVIPKTVVFVVDRSGSMSGEKIEQAKSSLKYMINSLGDKDTFNIVSYSSEVDLFQPELELVTDGTRKKALGYVDDIYSGGGTNINSALTTALDQLKDRKRPSYVLFLTDGLPTVGIVSESEISANALKANKVQARVFSFGVGFDVNSRLLDRLSRDQRGTSVYIKPEEDIEVAATNLFRKVSSPAMTGLEVTFEGETSQYSGSLVNRVYPRDLPDLFHGEQLVIVGRYKTDTAVTVNLAGQVGEKNRPLTLKSEFGDAKTTRRNGFVETLWATRRIGEIIDELDLNGQNKELIDELVALSLRHGIMTPYTSFLAEEDVSLDRRGQLLTEAEQLSRRGLSISSGASGFVQREFKKSLQEAQRSGSGSGGLGFGLGGSVQSVTGSRPSGGQPPGNRYSITGRGRGGGQTPSARSNSSRDSALSKSVADSFGGGRFRSEARDKAQAVAGAPASTPVGQLVAGESIDETAEGEAADFRLAPGKSRIKRIGTKTFYWKAKEWQDAELSTLKNSPEEKDIVTIEQFSDEYFALTKVDKGRWSRYLTLSEPTLIRIKDKTYRIIPPKPKKKAG